MRQVRVGLIGQGFMGKAHTHGYTDLPLYFDLGVDVVKEMLCSVDGSLAEFAKRWGWRRHTADWREVVNDNQVDLIDISTSNSSHAEIALAAIKQGKHVFCEKPLAVSMADAEAMVRAASAAGIVNMVGFNYRYVPAIALAKSLIQENRIGEVYHFRGIYQQSWLINPATPMVWRLKKEIAGYGPHGDLGAHIVDLARYLVGEIEEVCCAQEVFVHERPQPQPEREGVPLAAMDKVDVDDASVFLARFKGSKALGYFEATRYGMGHRNQNRVEINGSRGTIIFDMESMNELEYYSDQDEKHVQGFRRIQVGENAHPYMANWWPAGHNIGYGDSFVNQAYELISALKDGRKAKPDFCEGLLCERVLEAAQRSVATRKWEQVNLKL